MSETLSILALDFVTPADVPGPEAMRRAARPLTRAAEAMARLGGELLVRVGRGGVAVFARPEAALEAVGRLLLLDQETPADQGRVRVRAALHHGPLADRSLAVAEPTVMSARRLLDRAGPGEVLLTGAFRDGLGNASLSLAPLGIPPGEAAASPLQVAFRLLWSPAELTGGATRGTRLPGWAVAAALLVTTLTALAAFALALLGPG
jgi:hypothetical protein